jgi:hypothetical protein
MASPVRGASVARFLLAAPFFVAASSGGAFALAASVAPSVADAADGFNLRVIVKLAAPSGDTAAIAAEASRQASLPVTYAAAVDGTWHALQLHCADRAACDAAFARLRLSARYLAVELEGRKSRMMN